MQFLSFLTKILFKEYLILAFWGQNVGPGWVKNNGKKGCFHTSHFTINPVFPTNKVLNSHSLLYTLSKLKDELTDLNNMLRKFFFLLKLIAATAKRNLPSENLTVIHENCRAKLRQKSKVLVKNPLNICPK